MSPARLPTRSSPASCSVRNSRSTPTSRSATLAAGVLAGAVVMAGVLGQHPVSFAQETPGETAAPAETAAPTQTTQTPAAPRPPTPQSSPIPGGPTPAAETLTLTAMPPRLGDDGSLRVKPGESTQLTVRLKNNSTQPIAIRSSIKDFIVADDGVTPTIVEESVSNRWSLASWATVAPNYQVVPANGTIAVTVLVEVPADALPGGHYAMVVHQPDNPNAALARDAGTTGTTGQDEDAESASAINQQVGSLLYLIVEGPIKEAAFVTNFTFPKFLEYGPVPFSYSVDNQSDVHIQPKITVNIYNLFGRKIDSIPQETKNVFPLMKRDYQSEWTQVWGTGYYRAELTMSFGSAGEVVVQKTSFWLLPVKLILAGVIGLLALIAAGITIRRHLLHRRSDQSQRVKMLEDKLRQLEAEKLKKYDE